MRRKSANNTIKDSKNDWLAEEINREKRISVWANYDTASDLRNKHSNNCAAEAAKEAHHNECEVKPVSSSQTYSSSDYSQKGTENANNIENIGQLLSNSSFSKYFPENKEKRVAKIITVIFMLYIIFFVISFLISWF